MHAAQLCLTGGIAGDSWTFGGVEQVRCLGQRLSEVARSAKTFLESCDEPCDHGSAEGRFEIGGPHNALLIGVGDVSCIAVLFQ